MMTRGDTHGYVHGVSIEKTRTHVGVNSVEHFACDSLARDHVVDPSVERVTRSRGVVTIRLCTSDGGPCSPPAPAA
jgi:hypothetical protein